MNIDQFTYECLMAALSEIVPVAAVTAIIRLLSERGFRALGEAVGRRLLLRILRSVGSRIIPALGIAWTIWLIYKAISECL